MSFYTYILYSETHDRFYYGQTQDLNQRIIKHNSGSVKSSARFMPWKIYAYKECSTRKEAFLMEKQLKNCKSRVRMKAYIFRYNFIVLADQKVFGPENHNC